LIALKHYLAKNENARLILMSATINERLFSNYFSQEQIKNCLTSEYFPHINSKARLRAGNRRLGLCTEKLKNISGQSNQTGNAWQLGPGNYSGRNNPDRANLAADQQ
jgi:hypothetical protein